MTKQTEIEPLRDPGNTPEVAHWADRIRPHLHQAVESILAAGRELAEAKAALPHGEFGPLLDDLGLSRSMAQRFMRVAANPVLANAAPVQHLPPTVSVLDELTRWDPDDLADAIDAGTINSATTRAEAFRLAASRRHEERGGGFIVNSDGTKEPFTVTGLRDTTPIRPARIRPIVEPTEPVEPSTPPAPIRFDPDTSISRHVWTRPARELLRQFEGGRIGIGSAEHAELFRDLRAQLESFELPEQYR